jgi:hypothetical protein
MVNKYVIRLEREILLDVLGLLGIDLDFGLVGN